MAGVAHKTLPCGTRVEFYYRGRTVEVAVIDRGPYIAGRQWDLTQVTAEALGVTGTARVGVLVR
jgi:rare lipoprotein A (peptidoglycan hydrolase)